MRISAPSVQVCCEPKAALKDSLLNKKKNTAIILSSSVAYLIS